MLKQVSKFGLTGVINTLIDFSIFNLLVHLSGARDPISLFVMNSIAVSLAMLNSYVWNRYWTFQIKESHHFLPVRRFVMASLIGMIINSLTISLFITLLPRLALPPYVFLNLAKFLGALLSSSSNFFLYRYWVFAHQETESEAVNQEFIPGLVSIIIPAYNESKRLPARLLHLAQTLPHLFNLEIMVVDDGSKDNTADLTRDLSSQFPFIQLISYAPNRGKGKAVQTGMAASRGEYLIYTDADDTFTPSHIMQVLHQLMEHSDLVIACRKTSGKQRLENESPWRCLQGKVFNLLVQFLLLPGLKDTQCGLKGFRQELARKIFPLQRTTGFAFDVEILCLARALGFSIKEIELDAIDCAGSQVRKFLSPLQMGLDLLKLKVAFLTGRYPVPGRKSALSFALLPALAFFALLVRLPYLWEVPRFIDELREVKLAYMIYEGTVFPLHNVAHDIGALHNYILAGIFTVLGPGVYWPRLYVVLSSALTVMILYLIGKRLFGHRVGLIAAGLLLGNGMHILVSHMAWANCTTPFFFSLATLLLIKAIQEKSGGSLILSALFWAFALQTHASVIIYIMAALGYLLSIRKDKIFARHDWVIAAAAFLIAYSNMIYFNLQSRGGSFTWLSHKGYALESDPGLSSYISNLGNMVVELLRILSSSYAEQVHLWGYLSQPFFLLALVLLIYGALLAHHKKQSLPAWMIFLSFMIMPWINARYVFFISSRYIMPLVLMSILLISLAIVHLYEQIEVRMATGTRLAMPAIILFAVLSLSQLIPYYHYCNRVAMTNQSNRVTMQVFAEVMRLSDQGQTSIILDESTSLENNPLPDLFQMVQKPCVVVSQQDSSSIEKWTHLLENTSSKSLVLIMDQHNYERMNHSIRPEIIRSFTCKLTLQPWQKGTRKIYVVRLASE